MKVTKICKFLCPSYKLVYNKLVKYICRFLSSLTACVADSASLQIRNLPINQFPIIIIIRKYRSICEVADIIHGNINGDELYIHLMMNSDAFNEQMKVEIREENERAAREVLLNEQKQAYQESLLVMSTKLTNFLIIN